MTSLFLLFNHRLTPAQEQDAEISLGVDTITDMPDDIKKLWSQIPPDLPEISEYLEPIKSWLASGAVPGDYALIQGDFGACFIMVNFAFDRGLIPVYSTTVREAAEEHGENGAVKITHRFRHQIFRKYAC